MTKKYIFKIQFLIFFFIMFSFQATCQEIEKEYLNFKGQHVKINANEKSKFIPKKIIKTIKSFLYLITSDDFQEISKVIDIFPAPWAVHPSNGQAWLVHFFITGWNGTYVKNEYLVHFVEPPKDDLRQYKKRFYNQLTLVQFNQIYGQVNGRDWAYIDLSRARFSDNSAIRVPIKVWMRGDDSSNPTGHGEATIYLNNRMDIIVEPDAKTFTPCLDDMNIN